MATKQQKETQEKLTALNATIDSNFGGKTAADFTPETLAASLAAVNKPLIALLWGIAPNRKGEDKANVHNPRLTSANEAFSINAKMGMVENIAREVANQSNNNNNMATRQSGGMPIPPNMPQQSISVTRTDIRIDQYDKSGLERAYATMNFGSMIVSPELINQMWQMGQEILVDIPQKKIKKVGKCAAIIAGVAFGLFVLYKVVTREKNDDKTAVKVDDTDVKADDSYPYFEVEEVDIGNPSHEEVLQVSSFTTYL